MKINDIIKLMKQENLSTPVSSLNNRQFQAMLKRKEIELDGRKDNFILKSEASK